MGDWFRAGWYERAACVTLYNRDNAIIALVALGVALAHTAFAKALARIFW